MKTNYNLKPTYRLYDYHVIYCDSTGRPIKWVGEMPGSEALFVGDIFPYHGHRLELNEPKAGEIETISRAEFNALIASLPQWPHSRSEMIIRIYDDNGEMCGEVNVGFE